MSNGFARIGSIPFDPQALLDIYLLDNIDEAAKHAIVSFDQQKPCLCQPWPASVFFVIHCQDVCITSPLPWP